MCIELNANVSCVWCGLHTRIDWSWAMRVYNLHWIAVYSRSFAFGSRSTDGCTGMISIFVAHYQRGCALGRLTPPFVGGFSCERWPFERSTHDSRPPSKRTNKSLRDHLKAARSLITVHRVYFKHCTIDFAIPPVLCVICQELLRPI